MLAIILIILFALFEFSKHSIFKMGAKLFFLAMIIVIFLLFVVAQLDLKEYKDSDNEFIQTGASVIETIKESELADKLEVDIENAKEKVINRDNEDF